MDVLLSGIVGSTAYGLAGPESDVDRLGVFAAPTVLFHGLHPPVGARSWPVVGGSSSTSVSRWRRRWEWTHRPWSRTRSMGASAFEPRVAIACPPEGSGTHHQVTMRLYRPVHLRRVMAVNPVFQDGCRVLGLLRCEGPLSRVLAGLALDAFNVATAKPVGRSPIIAERTPSGLTHEGASGYARDAKGELFLLAVSNMVGEKTLYEKAGDRDERYENLIHQVAVADPEWIAGFLGWLRSEGNMRSASLVGGLEAAHAMLAENIPGGRKIVASVLQRADEPGEALAYWTSRYGRALPKPVKRGIADAALRLYAEYPLLKYDTESHGVRFADVLDLTHPGDQAGSSQRRMFKGEWQRDLFMHALARRHNRTDPTPETLAMIRANQELRALLAEESFAALDPERLRAAGMTWEDVLSLVGSKVDKAKLWEALIPSLGFMAMIRNLRNFDEAGVPDHVAQQVINRLTDPGQVAKSRQFPYRFLAAYEQAPSLRWGHALDTALNLSLRNVPELSGLTLVLIDTSASMTNSGWSARSKMTPAKAAAVFGVVLAARCGADLYGFADGVFRHDVPPGASVLREVDRFVKRTGEVGHGTNIAGSIRATFRNHDRVFVISDMQTMDAGTTSAVPANVPLYGFNLGGYRHGAFAAGTGNRHEFGGLTDATFRMVPLLEAGRDAAWPWLGKQARCGPASSA